MILAAGRGMRLRAVTDLPKCLLAPGGIALLDRYIGALDALEIPATIVAGYRADAIEQRIAELTPRLAPEIVINPDFEKGSIVSLARGLESPRGRPVAQWTATYSFIPTCSRASCIRSTGNALLVDVGTEFTGEEYMAGIDAGRVTELRRAAVPGHDSCGEWIGFARLDAPTASALKNEISAQTSAGRTGGGSEDALAGCLALSEVRCIETLGLPWIEIDFPEDARRAAEELSLRRQRASDCSARVTCERLLQREWRASESFQTRSCSTSFDQYCSRAVSRAGSSGANGVCASGIGAGALPLNDRNA